MMTVVDTLESGVLEPSPDEEDVVDKVPLEVEVVGFEVLNVLVVVMLIVELGDAGVVEKGGVPLNVVVIDTSSSAAWALTGGADTSMLEIEIALVLDVVGKILEEDTVEP